MLKSSRVERVRFARHIVEGAMQEEPSAYLGIGNSHERTASSMNHAGCLPHQRRCRRLESSAAHKMRNVGNGLRKKPRHQCGAQLRTIYLAPATREVVGRFFKWCKT